MNLTFEELRELIATLSQFDITELTLKSDTFELTVRKGAGESIPQMAIASPVATSAAPMVNIPMPTAPAPSAPSQTTAPPLDQKLSEITSPMVGTFYRAPAPDEGPFTEIGARIHLGETVCIIEAMKLMNEIEAEVAGEVVEILVENGEPVEYGQVLMRVKAN